MLGSLPRTPYLSQTRQPAFHRATACTAKRFQNPVAYFSFWNLFSGPLFQEKKIFFVHSRLPKNLLHLEFEFEQREAKMKTHFLIWLLLCLERNSSLRTMNVKPNCPLYLSCYLVFESNVFLWVSFKRWWNFFTLKRKRMDKKTILFDNVDVVVVVQMSTQFPGLFLTPLWMPLKVILATFQKLCFIFLLGQHITNHCLHRIE